MSRTALIVGVTGQDGAHLARLLLDKGYIVVGTSRDAMTASFDNLDLLGVRDRVTCASMAVTDFRSVLATLTRFTPTEVYNLAGQSSVALSFEQPVEAMESIATGTLNLLEAIRFTRQPIKFYNAGSGECFGDTGDARADEATPFRPRSPYAVAKAAAHGLVANYCDAYGIFACTGVLFNHESPLRPTRFVTQKIAQGAARIAAGSADKLRLGNLAIHRDWGWAPEYVDAMWRMLQQDRPQEFVIATGRTVSLEYFVERAFAHFGLDWRAHVEHDATLIRPSEIMMSRANPERANIVLGWHGEKQIDDVVTAMCGHWATALGIRSPSDQKNT
jgi:GDPmannose 4,6-dehydratase